MGWINLPNLLKVGDTVFPDVEAARNTRSVHVRSGLITIDETPRIKDRSRWGFICRGAAGGKGKEGGVEEEKQPFGKQNWRKRRG
jgi:hypothetical protein